MEENKILNSLYHGDANLNKYKIELMKNKMNIKFAKLFIILFQVTNKSSFPIAIMDFSLVKALTTRRK